MRGKIKFSNFYIFHCEQNCENNNETAVNFFPQTITLDTLSFQVNKIIETDNHRALDNFKYNFYLKKPYDDININDKSKHFLCYLRNCVRPHRNAIFIFSI